MTFKMPGAWKATWWWFICIICLGMKSWLSELELVVVAYSPWRKPIVWRVFFLKEEVVGFWPMLPLCKWGETSAHVMGLQPVATPHHTPSKLCFRRSGGPLEQISGEVEVLLLEWKSACTALDKTHSLSPFHYLSNTSGVCLHLSGLKCFEYTV